MNAELLRQLGWSEELIREVTRIDAVLSAQNQPIEIVSTPQQIAVGSLHATKDTLRVVERGAPRLK